MSAFVEVRAFESDVEVSVTVLNFVGTIHKVDKTIVEKGNSVIFTSDKFHLVEVREATCTE